MIWETKDDYKWSRWFAWYPVVLESYGASPPRSGGKKVWLEVVLRRYVGCGVWEYKLVPR